jgi:hypothetical protein
MGAVLPYGASSTVGLMLMAPPGTRMFAVRRRTGLALELIEDFPLPNVVVLLVSELSASEFAPRLNLGSPP